jgi:hypothetical protein
VVHGLHQHRHVDHRGEQHHGGEEEQGAADREYRPAEQVQRGDRLGRPALDHQVGQQAGDGDDGQAGDDGGAPVATTPTYDWSLTF